MFNLNNIQKCFQMALMAGLCMGSSLALAEGGPEAPAQYQSSCFACHSTGAAGAPKTGDTAAWADRMALGKEAMVASVRNGKGAMPPSGLCADCSDDDYARLIEYMAGSKFSE